MDYMDTQYPHSSFETDSVRKFNAPFARGGDSHKVFGGPAS
jgi:hypothetical protein